MAEYAKIETAMVIICDLCGSLYPDGYSQEKCGLGKCDWMEYLKETAADVAPTLRRWCMGGGRILAETSGAALRVDLLSPLRAVGISQLKNIVRIAAREWTVTTMPKRINPRRRPATMADVQRAKDTATADACRVTLAIFFTALLDKEGMEAEQLQRIWREVEALSESVRDGYVSAPDLIRVLREEYEIDIVGG